MRLGFLTRGSLLVVLIVALVNCAAGPEQTSEPMAEAAPAVPVYTPPIVIPESHDLTQADIERLMLELSNWGRWGPDDQLGVANLITPAKRLEAISLATEGITVSLAHGVRRSVSSLTGYLRGKSRRSRPDLNPGSKDEHTAAPAAPRDTASDFQTPGHVVVFTEQSNNSPRIIPLDGRPHISAKIRQFPGDSRGHWEGDTLVVESRNFTAKTRFQGSSEPAM